LEFEFPFPGSLISYFLQDHETLGGFPKANSSNDVMELRSSKILETKLPPESLRATGRPRRSLGENSLYLSLSLSLSLSWCGKSRGLSLSISLSFSLSLSLLLSCVAWPVRLPGCGSRL